MKDLFKAELSRFRIWAIAAAVVHVAALGFMTRLVDLAQQPRLVYQVLGMVYMVAGTLLGLYQMGTYRRPNNWLNLLHRPLHRLRIATGLCSAGSVLLFVAVAVPILVIATYQETMTARVVDVRHWLLPVAGLLIAWCGYLSGAYAMLADRRYSAAVFVLPNLFMYAQASGVAMLAVQGVVLLFLAGMVATAFKPDIGAPPRGFAATVATALPVQLGVYFTLFVLSFGMEMAWMLAGTHPQESGTPPPGGFTEANRSEPKDRLLASIAASRHADAPMWREQAALSDVFVLYPMRDLPQRNELTNLNPMEFEDGDRNIRWAFSHDRMRFVGYGSLDHRPRGELGPGPKGEGVFPGPAMPYGSDYVFSPGIAYQYDQEQQRFFRRVQLPSGEVFASPPDAAGDNIAVLSNRALYFYPGREANSTFDLLKPILRVPMPGQVGQLYSVDLMELLDGYLVSFTFTNGVWSGEVVPYQQVVLVDSNGNVQPVARRTLAFDLPLTYTMRTWWMSPPLRALSLHAQQLFAAHDPLKAGTIPPPPRHIVILAGVLCLLSLLAAIWLSGRQAHTPLARWSWVVACGLVGVPALISLWLLYPMRERLDDLPLAQPATA